MALALLFALALASSGQPAADASTPPPAADGFAAGSSQTGGKGVITEKALTREELEDTIPEGAPKDDYGFVAWCHGALAGQTELDPVVEKDMDAIEGKANAAKRKADDVEITKEHRRYLALYERALLAAEKASPTAIHQEGVDAELLGYKIWGPTRNKEPVWRMVDWGNWEVPPRCEKAAKRLYDRASLLGVALKPEDTPGPAAAAPPAAPAGPSDAGPPPAPDAKAADDGLRGPK